MKAEAHEKQARYWKLGPREMAAKCEESCTFPQRYGLKLPKV